MRGLSRALEAYGLAAAEPIPSGLINDTYLAVNAAGERVAVLQRLHRVFSAEVNTDIEAVTEHLRSHGVLTPALLRSATGERYVDIDDEVWRAISYVEGTTLERLENAQQAEHAGAMVARFHITAQSLEHEFLFVRSGVHDTAAHLSRLQAASGSNEHGSQVQTLREEILHRAAQLPALASDLPLRVCHGDLKVSNVRFALDRTTALCLVDLDTVGRQLIAYELGDMLRSWCNPAGEDEPDLSPDLEFLQAAMRGYANVASDLLTPSEVGSIAQGFEIVTIELAARFCVDIFEDCYFGWDAGRFPSRRDHNVVRARGQLSLGAAIAAQREAIASSIRGSFEAASE